MGIPDAVERIPGAFQVKVRMSKVEGNKLKVDDRDIVAFDRWKQKLDDGTEITANFTQRREDASERARNYFHVLRGRYAAAMGYDKEYAKNELMLRFGVWEEPRVATEWSGHLIDMYGQLVFRKSLNDYTKEELNELIEGTIMACIENGVDVAETVADYRRGV